MFAAFWVFEKWRNERADELKALSIQVTTSENWSADSGVGGWVDFEGDVAWGRVTAWLEGFADLEIILVENSANIYSRHSDSLCEADLDDWYSTLRGAPRSR